MSVDYKKRIQFAIEKFNAKTLPKSTRKKRNAKPEATIVLLVKNYLESIGFSMTIIEGKANYSEAAGRYLSGAVAPGYPDLSGNTSDGIAVYCEIKNTGKRSTLRPEQREFLISKIETNCFAIVCDSIEYFKKLYSAWTNLSLEKRRELLLSSLPPTSARDRARDQDLNFDD